MAAVERYPEELCVYEFHGSRLPLPEPVFEGFLGIWPEPPFYYVFYDRPVFEELQRWLDAQTDWELKNTYRLEYRQWQQIAEKEQRVGPFVIGSKISPDRLDGAVPLHIRHGLSFGTGVHPTTKGCLLSIAELYQGFPARHVVDLGTGTGILAVACARLGARRVLALDCNLLAVREARNNIRANGSDDVVFPLVADSLATAGYRADLLLMNLEWPCLQQVLQGEEWRGFPRVVLSGFLDSQENDLKPMLPRSFSVIHRTALENWITLVLEKQET